MKVKDRIMYVIQRADGKFYWKHPNIGHYYGYDSFGKAHLFATQKGAKLRLGYGSDGQECKVKQVMITLNEEESTMKSEQFNQLQTICTLDGLCYSLNYMIDELAFYHELPEEIDEGASELQEALQSFRKTVGDYVIAHKDTYIDKEEN